MGRDSLHGDISTYVAGELRAQRARLGLTYDEVAAASGIKRGTVVRTLSGGAAIAIDVLVPLCAALRLDVGAILDAAIRDA